MKINPKQLLNQFKPKKIVGPIIIGVGVALFLLFRNFDVDAFKSITWTQESSLWILLAIVMVVLRDFGYMYRIRVLTDNHLSWRKSFDVIMLWEFASSITPSIIGGTAFAFFLLIREKIAAGKSTAIVLVTAFLDELFFILLTPIFFFILGADVIFPSLKATGLADALGGNNMVMAFTAGYLILFIYTAFLLYGLFLNPKGLKWIIVKVANIRFLRKWKENAENLGDELIIAGQELKSKSAGFWSKTFGATVLSWTARYFVVNCIIMAFGSQGFGEHLVIYGRQLVMWIIMLIPITPGGSGVAEIVFPAFLGDYIPVGLAASLALLWRLLSYYPYLFIGAVLLPRWVRRVYTKKEMEEDNISDEEMLK